MGIKKLPEKEVFFVVQSGSNYIFKQVSLGYIVRNNMLLSPMAQAYIQAMEDYAEKYRQSHEA